MAPQVAKKGSKDLKEKSKDFLKRVGLSNDRILTDDIEECGYDEDTGVVWMKWKVKYEFEKIGRLVQYDTEIRGYVEQHKMKKVSGVNSSEWITTTEISIDDRASAQICLKSDIGNNKSIVAPLHGPAGSMRG